MILAISAGLILWGLLTISGGLSLTSSEWDNRPGALLFGLFQVAAGLLALGAARGCWGPPCG